MDEIKLSFLLDLFNAGFERAYFSVAEFTSEFNTQYTRMEMIVPNVGRLCLYQTFIENDSGEQIPTAKVFYTSATQNNIRTLIKSPKLIRKAALIIYKTKRFCENNPQYRISSDKELEKIVERNKKLLTKQYEKAIGRKKQNWWENFIIR